MNLRNCICTKNRDVCNKTVNYQQLLYLSGGSHGLLHGPLDTELSLLELVSGSVLLLEYLESLGNLGLDGGTCSSLDLGGEFGSRDGLFTSVEVSLEVRLGLVLGREVSVGVLEPGC